MKYIYIVNRTFSTAESVQEAFKGNFEVTVLPGFKALPDDLGVIIGTIPADVASEEQFNGIFGSRGLCIDMAYKPRQTTLLSVAKWHEEWEIITGIQVLLVQAFDQYRM